MFNRGPALAGCCIKSKEGGLWCMCCGSDLGVISSTVCSLGIFGVLNGGNPPHIGWASDWRLLLYFTSPQPP